MSKNDEEWCSGVIREGLSANAPSADALIGRREAALLWHRLVQTGAGARCAPMVAAALRQASAARAVEAHVVNRELARALDAARTAGIDVVAIKGAAIAHTHYPQPHLRPRGDSDLLVRVEDRERIGRVLRDLGYAPGGAVDGSLVTRQAQWTRSLGRDLAHTIDVHWELFNPRAFSGVLDTQEVFDRSVPVPALSASARAPHPVHALLIACVHRVAHHAGHEDLVWLYDVRLLAESLSDEEAAEFVMLATGRQVAAVCADGLRAAQRAVGGDMPAPLRAWLNRTPNQTTAEPTARFLRPLREVDHVVSDLRALTGLAMRVRLVKQHLFPRPDYVLRKYGARSRILLPYLYLRRIVEGAPRWFSQRSDSDSKSS
jgi:hypothetical protein